MRILSAAALYSLLFSVALSAQTSGKWTDWTPLYSDSYIAVEVQFYKPAVTACQTNGKNFKFKYRVKGRYRNTPFYLNWKMDYMECDNKSGCRINSLEIGKASPDDISNWRSIESMEFSFPAKSINEKFYDQQIGGSSISGPCNNPVTSQPQPPVVTVPTHRPTVRPGPPPAPSKTSRYYDDTGRFLQYGFGIGAEWVKSRVLADVSRTGTSYQESVNIFGIGIPAELIFHPLIKEHFSIGLQAGGAIGTTPLLFSSGETEESDGSTSKESYFYYRWNLGAELALGLRSVKLLGTLNRSGQHNNFELLKKYGTNNETRYAVKGTQHAQTTGIGLRIGRYLKRFGSGGDAFDVLYTFTDNPEGQFLGSPFDNLAERRHGISLMWWKLSMFKLRFDIAMGTPGESIFNSDWSGTSFQLSFAFNWSRFL